MFPSQNLGCSPFSMVNKNTNMCCCWTSNKNHQKSADLESCWGKTGHLKKKCYQKWRHLTHPDTKALFCSGRGIFMDFQQTLARFYQFVDHQRIMDLSNRSVFVFPRENHIVSSPFLKDLWLESGGNTPSDHSLKHRHYVVVQIPDFDMWHARDTLLRGG